MSILKLCLNGAGEESGKDRYVGHSSGVDSRIIVGGEQEGGNGREYLPEDSSYF
jgi:hypothetical protein